VAYYGFKPAEQAIQIGDNTIVSADIADGSIVNADLNASAAIAMSKTQFVAGTGLTLDTNTLNLDTITSAASLVTVGTIGTGVWQGTPITSAYLNASQTAITSVGTLSSFRSTGIDDNADATAITIDSSERVGIGETSPDGKLHIRSDSGAGSVTADSYASDLIVEAQNAGMTIMSLDAGDSSLVWGSASDNIGVQAKWNYNANAFRFRTSRASAKFVL